MGIHQPPIIRHTAEYVQISFIVHENKDKAQNILGREEEAHFFILLEEHLTYHSLLPSSDRPSV